MFQTAQEAMRDVSPDAQKKLMELLKRTGGQAVMDVTLPRAMTRLNNVLVLK